MRYPYQLTVGDKEMANGQVSIRKKAENLGSVSVDELIEMLKKEIAETIGQP